MKTLILTAVALAASTAAVQAVAQAAVSPVALVDQFEATNGKFEGYRRSGAKGICAMGEFVGTADARGLSTASAFSGQPIPVIVRFSVGGANPKAADNAKSQRNLALQFNLPGGERWLMGNIGFGGIAPA
jgi:catalase